jgi:hypothetical protein
MITNDGLEITHMWKLTIMVYFNLLTQNFHGQTEEKYE